MYRRCRLFSETAGRNGRIISDELRKKVMDDPKTDKSINNIKLGHYFDYIEIESDYLINLLYKVIEKIINSGFQQELVLGSIIERKTNADEPGEVTIDNDIIIDSEQLKKYEDDVAMALIAHELAHSFLKHYENWGKGLENEYEADNLAKEWGFDVDKFRKACGPPTVPDFS